MALKFPADFDKCVKEGGRVRTEKPKEGKYLHVCYDKAGKSHAGEVKSKKEASEVDSYLINLGYEKEFGEFVMASKTELKSLVPQIKLSENIFKQKTAEIEVLHAGKWEHPQYGIIKISEEDIDKFVQSFEDNVRKVDLAVDQEHMPEKGAAGWYRSLKKVVEDGKTKLKATIEWTKLGKQLIKDGIFKYFSPEFDFDYEDLETHENFENVLIGGALTNRPYFKSLAPVALSENLYAGFTSKLKEEGGEKKMTRKELKAKLVEDSDFKLDEKASDKDKKVFDEIKAEIAKEAEDTKKAKEKEEKEKEKEKKNKKKNKKMSEEFISSADHTKQMNEMRSKLGVVEKKLRFKEVTAEVGGFVFSESNPKGVLLPKNEKAAIDLLMAVTPKVAKLFTEFMDELPAVSSKLFREEGGDDGEGSDSEKVQAEAKKMMDKEKGLTYGDAIKRLQNEKPDLFPKEKEE